MRFTTWRKMALSESLILRNQYTEAVAPKGEHSGEEDARSFFCSYCYGAISPTLRIKCELLIGVREVEAPTNNLQLVEAPPFS